MNSSENARGALMMMLSMAAFTLNDTCMKVVAADVPMFQAVTLRGIATSIALLVIGHWTGGLRLRLPRPVRRIVGLRSVAEIAGTATFLAALAHMPLANLSAILQAMPLAVTLGAALVFGEKIGWRRMTAIAIGFCGVLVIIRPGPEGFDLWALVGLSSMVAVVVRDLVTRRLPPETPSITVALWSALAVTVAGAVLSSSAPWQPVSPKSALLVLGAASFLIVGYISAVLTMRMGEVGATAPFRYTSLVWAIVLGWAVFGDIPDGLTLVGAAIVVASGLFTYWRERQLARRPAAPPPPL
jgi:drug/metabolite transporter (DMT)-like permease